VISSFELQKISIANFKPHQLLDSSTPGSNGTTFCSPSLNCDGVTFCPPIVNFDEKIF
jgi:hypothetical protein